MRFIEVVEDYHKNTAWERRKRLAVHTGHRGEVGPGGGLRTRERGPNSKGILLPCFFDGRKGGRAFWRSLVSQLLLNLVVNLAQKALTRSFPDLRVHRQHEVPRSGYDIPLYSNFLRYH